MTGPAIAAAGLAASMSLGILSPFLSPDARSARDGLASYKRGEYVEAVDRFRKALEDEPDPRIRYNLGSAAYQGQNYPEAAEAFGAVVGTDAIPPGNAAYDLGNVLFRSDKLQEALKAYRQALRENPGDADARYNYELTQRRLSGQDSTQSQDPPEPQSGENGQSQDSPDRKQASPDSSAQSPPDQAGPDATKPDSGSGSRPQETQEQAGREGEAPPDAKDARLLTPEEAQRLLNAVTPEERELIQARLRAGKRRQVEKDW
jgi:tetratricopeptide (TPR) repeat protein